MNVIKTKNNLVCHDKKIVRKLKALARKSPIKRSRVCLHKTLKDNTNEMIIALMKDSYIRPHIHPNAKSESYHIIEGKMKVFIFNKNGKLLKIVEMGDYKSGNIFYYRMNKGFYHMPVSITNFCIYHETYSGPFNKKKDVHFPMWAPEQNFFIGVKSLISKVKNGF
ncbi:WbuC family cupin fold metalloprotein [Candidatus Pelagibacter bacterium]|mgnify:CR=1 FL=1|jgi:cupin fold WbuC family metalloprotein|nr:WbuC family cupin fold metalloprotein [Candidatus Pelagibacter bacterium]MDB2708841.1 WbuC family cupin fold metalloprotein [Candidatus Pelagibacter bacterium]